MILTPHSKEVQEVLERTKRVLLKKESIKEENLSIYLTGSIGASEGERFSSDIDILVFSKYFLEEKEIENTIKSKVNCPECIDYIDINAFNPSEVSKSRILSIYQQNYSVLYNYSKQKEIKTENI